MFGTAITELFTGQWIDVLLKNVTDNAIIVIDNRNRCNGYWAGHLQGRLYINFSPQGVLLISAILAALGLYLLGHTTGNMLFVGAIDIWYGGLLFLANDDWVCIRKFTENRSSRYEFDGWCRYVCRISLYDIYGGVL